MAMAGPDRPWRLALGSPACAYSAGCGSLLVPLISLSVSLFSLLAPFARVGERGDWASGFVARRGRIVPDWLRLLLASDGGDECVDFVDCLSSIDCAGMIGYILNRALSMVRRLISLVFSVDGFASSW